MFGDKVTVTRTFIKGVTHVVTTLKWLSSNRSVDHLFAIAEIKSIHCMVPFEWLCACVEQRRLVSTQSFALGLPSEFAKAHDAPLPLLAGNLFYFSGDFESGNAGGSKPSASRGSSLGLGRVVAEKRDLMLLAALQGGQVVDILNRDRLVLGPNGVYRGYTVQDLQARALPSPSGQQQVVRVIVPTQDAVSRLGLEIFSTAHMRPLLSQWLTLAIQTQDTELGDRFEVFGVAK